MKLISTASTLEKITKATNDYIKIYFRNSYPITTNVGNNIVKLFSSAMNELNLAVRNISECSSVARYLYSRVKQEDRQKFMDYLEQAIWEVGAFSEGKVNKLSPLAQKINNDNSLDKIVDCIITELYAPVNERIKVIDNKKDFVK